MIRFFSFFPGGTGEVTNGGPRIEGIKIIYIYIPNLCRYCGWFRNPANQLRWVVYLIICQVFDIPSGAPLCSCAPIPSAVYLLTQYLEHWGMVNLREFFRMTFGCHIMTRKRRWQRKLENDSHPEVQSEPKSFMVFVVQNVRFSCRFAYKPLIPTNQPTRPTWHPTDPQGPTGTAAPKTTTAGFRSTGGGGCAGFRGAKLPTRFFPLGLVKSPISWMLRWKLGSEVIGSMGYESPKISHF